MGKGPSHIVTSETKAKVSALKSFGNTEENIAKYLGISHDTLRRHYAKVLDTAVIDANAAVATSLFKKATVSDDVSAQIFWLKTRARWRTADEKKILETNDQLKEEVRALRAKLDEKNKRDY